MNAETVEFVRALQGGPQDLPAMVKLPDGRMGPEIEYTHFYIIDNSKAEDDPNRIAKYNMSQLWSYSDHASKSVEFVLGCGYKALPRQMWDKFKKSRTYFTGNAKAKGKASKEDPTALLTKEEFDALCEKYEGQFLTSPEMKDYPNDSERDANMRQVGINLWRDILNSPERVQKMMFFMQGVMAGGYRVKGIKVWPRYRNFFQYIISGMILDYKNRNEKRKEDPEAELEFPHLSYSALASAIHQAKVDLTSKNTDSRGSMSVQPGQLVKDNGDRYATLPHLLKWLLVLGQSEKALTPEVYQEIASRKNKWLKWCAYNLGAFLPYFHLEIGQPAPNPDEGKSRDDFKPKPYRRASTFNRRRPSFKRSASSNRGSDAEQASASEVAVDDSDSETDDADKEEKEAETPAAETPDTPATEHDESGAEDESEEEEEEEEEEKEEEKEEEESDDDDDDEEAADEEAGDGKDGEDSDAE